MPGKAQAQQQDEGAGEVEDVNDDWSEGGDGPSDDEYTAMFDGEAIEQPEDEFDDENEEDAKEGAAAKGKDAKGESAEEEADPAKDAKSDADKDKAAEAEKDKQPARDFEKAYTNQVAATREAREENKELRALLNKVADRLKDGRGAPAEKVTEKAAAEDPAKAIPSVDLALIEKIRATNDPLEKINLQNELLAQQAQAINWFTSQYKGNQEKKAAADQRTEKERTADAERVQFYNDVRTKVEDLIPEEEKGAFSEAYSHVLQEHATQLYRANVRRYRAEGFTDKEIQDWAIASASHTLHEEAADLLRVNRKPHEALLAEAKRYGWTPKVEAEAAKAAKEKADAEKKLAEAKAKGEKSQKAAKARETLSTSLGKAGKSNGGGVQSFDDLVAAVRNGEVSGDQFDQFFDQFGGNQYSA